MQSNQQEPQGSNTHNEAAEPRDVWATRPGTETKESGSASVESKKRGADKGQWERGVLEKLAFSALKEQRSNRRWRIFFMLLFVAYLGFITWTVFSQTVLEAPSKGSHTAMVNIKGVIAEDEPSSARLLFRPLREAFENEQAKAVVLNINSPGGSPVQAGIIRDEILRLKAKHQKPVHAVIGDLGASAAYYIAVAADDIYVDKASMVGSIGVLMNGFGFTGTMEKLGVERRLLSAGDHKGFLDPFSPQNPQDVAHARKMLQQIHQQFIDVVKSGRGDRLKETSDMFSGLVWTGEEALTLGLADAYGSVYSVARDVVHEDKIIDYTPRRGLADQLARRLGASFGSALGVGIGEGAVREIQGPATPWR